MGLFKKLSERVRRFKRTYGPAIIIGGLTLLLVGGVVLKVYLDHRRFDAIERYNRFMQEKKTEEATNRCRSRVYVIPEAANVPDIAAIEERCDPDEHVTAVCDEGTVRFVACVCPSDSDDAGDGVTLR